MCVSQYVSIVGYITEFKMKSFPDIYNEIKQDLYENLFPTWSQISIPKIYFPIKSNPNCHSALQRFAKSTPRIYWNYGQTWMTQLLSFNSNF